MEGGGWERPLEEKVDLEKHESGESQVILVCNVGFSWKKLQIVFRIFFNFLSRNKSCREVTLPSFPDPIPEVMWSRGRVTHQPRLGNPLEQNYCYIFFCQNSCGLWSDQKIEIRIVSYLIKVGVHPANKTGRYLGVKLLLHLYLP